MASFGDEVEGGGEAIVVRFCSHIGIMSIIKIADLCLCVGARGGRGGGAED